MRLLTDQALLTPDPITPDTYKLQLRQEYNDARRCNSYS